jgi:hypothetical protein
MIIKVTCVECVKPYQTSIPDESWKQYQDGIPVEIAFHNVSENATNLVVNKMCPTCQKESGE